MVLRIAIIILITNFCLAQDLKPFTAESYYAKNPSLERKTILDFLIHQFDEKSVNQAELDRIWNNKNIKTSQSLIRFQIVDQKLYLDSNIRDLYFVKLHQYFTNFVKKYKVNDVDFIVVARDEIIESIALNESFKTTPVFMMSKNINSLHEKNTILMPDALILDSNRWETLIPKIKKANQQINWDKKEEKIFWRGGTHGSESKYFYNISNFDKLARLKLVIFSKLYPNLIDAQFTSFAEFSNDQDGKNLRVVLNLLFGENPSRVSEEDHLKYKYLITIDGNTCPWVRVPWIMLSNSVLVKQETGRIEWFYPAIKPYIHYIPVNNNLTNIFEQIEWAKSHDKEAQQISLNAQNFIRNNLMPEDIDIQMAIILNKYSEIQTDKKIIVTLPPADEVLSTMSLIKLLFHKIKARVFN